MSDEQRLTRADVARVMGWANEHNLHVALHRSRRGGTPFPEPGDDGRWSRADVEVYRDGRSNRAMGLDEAQRARIRRMARDGVKAPAIAAAVGCRPASVYRILNQESQR